MDVLFTDRRMEWRALSKQRKNADDGLASRPQGGTLSLDLMCRGGSKGYRVYSV
jgi:hypothetical protein